MRARGSGWIVAVVVALATIGARAQQRDPAAAELLFREARKALARGKTEEACAKFAESQRLDPGAGTLINLAACREKLGQLATAWENWQAALRTLPPEDDRRPAVQKRAQALESRLPRLEIKPAPGAPPDLRVKRGEVELGPAAFGLPLPVDPGEHTVEVSSPAHDSRRYTVTLREAEKKLLLVEPGPARVEPKPALTPAPAPVPPPRPAPVEAPPPAQPSNATRTIGFVVAGAGAVSLLVGGVTGALALDKKNELDEECVDAAAGRECSPAGLDAADTGETYATISTITVAAGVVAVGVGAWLILSGGSTPIAAGVQPTTGGALAGVRGAF